MIIGLLFILAFIPALWLIIRNLPGKATAGHSFFNWALVALAIGLNFAAMTLNFFTG